MLGHCSLSLFTISSTTLLQCSESPMGWKAPLCAFASRCQGQRPREFLSRKLLWTAGSKNSGTCFFPSFTKIMLCFIFSWDNLPNPEEFWAFQILIFFSFLFNFFNSMFMPFLVAKAWLKNQPLLCLSQPKNFLFYDKVAGGKLSPV